MAARYVIAGTRRIEDVDRGLHLCGATVYVSRSGCTTYDGAKAAVIRTLPEARKEVEYWKTNQSRYLWAIEELPKRVAVATAVLRASPVE